MAIAKLSERFADTFTPEAIFEGAVKGGAVVLLSCPAVAAADVADLLEAIATEFRQLGAPKLSLAVIVEIEGE